MNEENIKDGMTDMQFKSFLKQLAGRLETARGESEPDEMRTKLDEVIRDLQHDIAS